MKVIKKGNTSFMRIIQLTILKYLKTTSEKITLVLCDIITKKYNFYQPLGYLNLIFSSLAPSNAVKKIQSTNLLSLLLLCQWG